MATNNSSQAINASVDDISTESVLNEGLDLPISTEAGSTAPFSWEVLQDESANFSVTSDRMAQVIQQTVGRFASDPGFDSKMALAFGAGNDYSGLKSAWQAGMFDAFPQIEVRTGAELAGANAAYAGLTNTIYVSQDFLRQNANNSQAIASVLVEEFGHSVDRSVNAIDTPGDEGELFSAIVRGVDLGDHEIQMLKQETDSLSIYVDGAIVEGEASFGEATPTTTQGIPNDQNIQGITYGSTRWASNTVTYSFTNSIDDYETTYQDRSIHESSFRAFASNQQQVFKNELFPLFSNVSGLIFKELTGDDDRNATIRIAESDVLGIGAFVYQMTKASPEAGDMWIGKNPDYDNNFGIGTYARTITFMHEIGHTVGLKHGHEAAGSFTTIMENNRNSNEFSIMTYRQYIGDSISVYTAPYGNAPQSLMMYDIAAIQHLYGANFGFNSTNTIYQFSPDTGEMFITDDTVCKGEGQPVENVVFRTIWDGKGTDTYDFSNYTTRLRINLEPGNWSDLDVGGNSQRANLGDGKFARGHVFNALLFDNNLQSLIENAIGGSNSDEIIGNDVGNYIQGQAGKDRIEGQNGNDTLYGQDGADTLFGGAGDDTLDGGSEDSEKDYLYGGDNNDELYGWGGSDELYGQAGSDRLFGQDGHDLLDGGNEDNGADFLYGGSGEDTLRGWDGNDDLRGEGDDDLIEAGNGDDVAYGGDGWDTIEGNADKDQLYGEAGWDRIDGGSGEDTIYGGTGWDYINGGDQKDTLYGDEGNDIILGGEGDDFIDGGSGWNITIQGASILSRSSFSIASAALGSVDSDDDELYGEGGNDELHGRSGDDTIWGGSGNDTAYGDEGVDVLYGDVGDDRLFGGDNRDTLYGGIGDDKLWGGDDNDELWGEDGDDTINGDAGNDLIYGGEDNDTLSGGLDNDRIYGEGGNDRISGDEGNDLLFGQDGNDAIDGGIGDDYIEAGIGIDTLNGGDGIDTLFGQNDNDILNGDAGDDFLDGGNGNDQLFGGDGNDQLLGQAGNDVMYGNAGDDAIDGGAGKDYLEGNAGNDTLNGGADIDTLYGNEGDDILNGDDGKDTLFGGAGNDRISGGGDVDMVSYLTSPSGVVVNLDENKPYRNDRQANANNAINPDNPAAYYTDLEANFAINPGSAADGYGNTDTLTNLENITGSQFADVLIGNSRDNTIFGLGGDDLLVGGGENDQFYGGNGIDTISYRRSPGGVTVNLETNSATDGQGGSDRIFDTENIVGSKFNDTLIGDAKANIITAGGGNDTVSGGAGDDTLYGESGDDQVSGGIGNDTLYGNLGKDTLNGDAGDDLGYSGAGDDRLNGGDGSDILWGDQGNDALNGGTGDDFLDGGTGNDTLNGNEGNDQLFGQAGDDLLDGGSGIDILFGGDGKDQLFGQAGDDILEGGLGNDRLFGGDDNDTLNGQAGNDLLEGGAGNDILSGGDGADQLFGQAGDDSLEGGTGNDFLDGGLGNDTLSGNDGNDQLFGQVGNDILEGGAGDDLLDGGIGNDTLNGGSGNDQLLGQAGDDTLNGGLGDDRLKGGEGSDILSGGGGRDLFYINRGEGPDSLLDFTGVGRGTNPAPYLVSEIDTIVFSGAALVAKTMLLSQTGGNLVISFEDIDNTSVTLQNFALENLDNHHTHTGASLTVGNILFNGDTSIRDSFDVINAEVNLTQVLRPHFVTFLNDLDNKTNGFDHSNDVINGQGGNDTLRGLGGNDILRGGEGNDYLIGGAGNDYLAGQWGNDYLEGGLGDDYLRGGTGDDFLIGGFGNDRIEGGLGNDQMFGAGGRDRFVIYRGDGVDTIADFDGVGPGSQPYKDIINEADIIQFLGTGLIAKNMILTQTDYEPITGNSLVITFEGITDTTVKLTNFAMENLDNLSTLNSAGMPIGNILFQFDGDTTIQDSFDVFNSDWVMDQVLRSNTVTFLNDLDNDTMGFDHSNDVINGQGGNDILLGLSGNDILRGGIGNDVLIGGNGNNILTGNAGFDTFVLSLGGSSFINDFTLGQDFIGLSDGLTFEQLNIEQGTGVNAGSTSIKILGDESILMSLSNVQASALNTAMFLPSSSIFQPAPFV